MVIPWAATPELLERQLEALSRQDLGEEFEVICVCNSSELWRKVQEDPKSKHLAEDEVLSDRIRKLSILASDVSGAAHARNAGWKRASGSIIAFCDGDDEVDEKWLSGFREVFRDSPGIIVAGSLEYAKLNSAGAARWNRTASESAPLKFSHKPFGPSANLAMSTDSLNRLGGFDETFLTGEDIDLCWRAQYLSIPFVFCKAATVHYRLREKPSEVWRQALNYGRSDGQLLIRHRCHGARRGLRDSLRDIAAIAWALVTLPRADGKNKLLQRLGIECGRTISTFRFGTWVI